MLPIRVDFYLIKETDPTSFWNVVCRLLDKAYQHPYQVLVRCKSQSDCDHLDALLWSYQDTSFIPHANVNERIDAAIPIRLGVNPPIDALTELVMNCDNTIFTPTPHLKRIIEVIPNCSQDKAHGRERFRAYKTQGLLIHTHEI